MSRKTITRLLMKIGIWPVVVILTINLENWASEHGFSRIWAGRGEGLLSIIDAIRSVAASSWVLYPTTFLAGMVFFAWLIKIFERVEASGGFDKIMVKGAANNAHEIFRKSKTSRLPELETLADEIDKRRQGFGLPKTPRSLSEDKQTNRLISEYFKYLHEGDFALAKRYYERVVGSLVGESPVLLSPPSGEAETPH